jgi:hypothetical protein
MVILTLHGDYKGEDMADEQNVWPSGKPTVGQKAGRKYKQGKNFIFAALHPYGI